MVMVMGVCALDVCRLGEVTLKDVKGAVDCKGSLRYHFKALDPEFGTVKEEVGGGDVKSCLVVHDDKKMCRV